jgi:hypothetical protein
MRIVYRLFEDGSRQVYTTTLDGNDLQYLEGSMWRPLGKSGWSQRVVACIEATYDDEKTHSRSELLKLVDDLLGRVGRVGQPTPKPCSHEFVNISFNGIVMACKHCGVEQGSPV